MQLILITCLLCLSKCDVQLADWKNVSSKNVVNVVLSKVKAATILQCIESCSRNPHCEAAVTQTDFPQLSSVLMSGLTRRNNLMCLNANLKETKTDLDYEQVYFAVKKQVLHANNLRMYFKRNKIEPCVSFLTNRTDPVVGKRISGRNKRATLDETDHDLVDKSNLPKKKEVMKFKVKISNAALKVDAENCQCEFNKYNSSSSTGSTFILVEKAGQRELGLFDPGHNQIISTGLSLTNSDDNIVVDSRRCEAYVKHTVKGSQKDKLWQGLELEELSDLTDAAVSAFLPGYCDMTHMDCTIILGLNRPLFQLDEPVGLSTTCDVAQLIKWGALDDYCSMTSSNTWPHFDHFSFQDYDSEISDLLDEAIKHLKERPYFTYVSQSRNRICNVKIHGKYVPFGFVVEKTEEYSYFTAIDSLCMDGQYKTRYARGDIGEFAYDKDQDILLYTTRKKNRTSLIGRSVSRGDQSNKTWSFMIPDLGRVVPQSLAKLKGESILMYREGLKGKRGELNVVNYTNANNVSKVKITNQKHESITPITLSKNRYVMTMTIEYVVVRNYKSGQEKLLQKCSPDEKGLIGRWNDSIIYVNCHKPKAKITTFHLFNNKYKKISEVKTAQQSEIIFG